MKFEKSPAWLVHLFEALAPGDRRKMFGYPCSFERGQLFCGLFADGLFVRLGDAERAELLAAPGARRFEPMPGRPMREYVVLPAGMLEDEAAVERWMRRAQEFASPQVVGQPREQSDRCSPAAPAGVRSILGLRKGNRVHGRVQTTSPATAQGDMVVSPKAGCVPEPISRRDPGEASHGASQ
jgi:hypothetical protein